MRHTLKWTLLFSAVLLLTLTPAVAADIQPNTAVCYHAAEGGPHFDLLSQPSVLGSGLTFETQPTLDVYIQGACLARFSPGSVLSVKAGGTSDYMQCSVDGENNLVYQGFITSFVVLGTVPHWTDAESGDQYWATPSLTCRKWHFSTEKQE